MKLRRGLGAAIAGAACALAVVFSTPQIAMAGTVNTGARSCGAGTAFTYGTVARGSTVRHYQLVAGTWWASPLAANPTDGGWYTTWWYYFGNKSFSNSQIETSLNTATGAGTSCT